MTKKQTQLTLFASFLRLVIKTGKIKVSLFCAALAKSQAISIIASPYTQPHSRTVREMQSTFINLKRGIIMSWNDVSGVSKFQIWTEPCASSTDGSEAWLFVNGRHQIKVTVGISLGLNYDGTELPSVDEVKNALTLVSNKDGGSIKYLVAGNAGSYCEVYEPNHSALQANLKANNFQYTFEYYFSSNTAKNPNIASEEISAKLTYTDKYGNVISNDMSANSDYYQKGYIKVHCLSQRTNKHKIVKNTSQPYYNVFDNSSWGHEDPFVDVYRMTIEDSYFNIQDFSLTPQSWRKTQKGITCLALDMYQSDGPKWQNTTQCFCPTLDYGLGEKWYSVDAYVYQWPDPKDGSYYGNFRIEGYTQKAHEIVFFCTTIDFDDRDSNHRVQRPTAHFITHDQFGNETTVDVAINYGEPCWHMVWPTLDGNVPPFGQ
ncbi:hypothetical protein [Trabulsiella odontotermitis]|nr:hypothetical protein [Trabulsiella odontotermitis]